MGPSQADDTREVVLIVDDNAANRTLLERSLAAEYVVLEAEDGFQALEAVRREPIDLVLLDVMMPGFDGYEACRQIKAHAGDRFLPVILLTALSQQQDRNQGLAAGADDFLSKPFDRTELLLRARALLRIRRQEATIQRQVEDLRRLQALKDDLTGLILHDLRNPLCAVDGYLTLLSRRLAGHPDTVVLQRLERAGQTCRRLKEITEGMLEVQGLEAAAVPMRREAGSLRKLVERAAATLQGAAEAANICIDPRVEGEAEVCVDHRLVARALENLIGNALHYSSEGGTVEVAARRCNGRVFLEVADRGPGVPDEFKARIFERYGSVEGGQNGNRRGHGLGLHLVKLVADAHGGSASVHDREGGGSVFRLALPAEGPTIEGPDVEGPSLRASRL